MASRQASFLNLWCNTFPLSNNSYEVRFSVGLRLARSRLEISISPKSASDIFLTISSCTSKMSSRIRSYLLFHRALPSLESDSSTEILTRFPDVRMLPETA